MSLFTRSTSKIEGPVESGVDPAVDPADPADLAADSAADPAVEPAVEPAVDPVVEPVVEPDVDPHVDPSEEKTVRIVRRRFVRRQWRRRWLAWRKVVAVVLVVGLVAGAAWLVFFSSVLAVSGVQVEGTRLVSVAAVRRAAAVPTGTPLATADLDDVTARVRRLVAVRSVDVSRAWPDRIRIDVVERRPVAVVEPPEGGPLRGIDATGIAFRDYDARPRDLPVIRRGADTDTAALAEAAVVAGSLPPKLAEKVAYVEVASVDRISLELRNGPTVVWGSAAESRNKARVLAVLLTQQAASYDISVPGQPIIRK